MKKRQAIKIRKKAFFDSSFSRTTSKYKASTLDKSWYVFCRLDSNRWKNISKRWVLQALNKSDNNPAI